MGIDEQLANLARLRTDGVLSEAEFEAAKRRLLSEAESTPRSRRRLWILVLGVLVILAIAGAVTIWNNVQADHRREQAAREAAQEEREAAEAEAQADAAAARAEAEEAEEAEAAAEAAAAAEARQREERRRQSAIYNRCREKYNGLLEALQNMDSRLDSGLTFDEYDNLLNFAQAEYDTAIPGRNPSFKCLTRVGVPSEASLNAYIEAYNIWLDCPRDCNSAIQDQWATASSKLLKARSSLANLRPPI